MVTDPRESIYLLWNYVQERSARNNGKGNNMRFCTLRKRFLIYGIINLIFKILL